MNPFQAFLANRAAKGGVKPIVNDAAPVTRAEFNAVAAAVQALIEDFDTVTAPDKIKGVINSAFQAVANEAASAPGKYTAPSGDGELRAPPPRTARTAIVSNAAKLGYRAPLALPGE